ncbi:hypothetical protein A5875_003672, partial [Enterococcus sp. 3H8_DIV0648]
MSCEVKHPLFRTNNGLLELTKSVYHNEKRFQKIWIVNY